MKITLFSIAVTSAALIAMPGSSNAQSVPSVYSPGCKGVLCQSGDPRTLQAPPPCTGLICGMTPYSMQTPVTASDVKRLQEQQAREAAAAPPAVVAPEPKKVVKKVVKKTPHAKVAKTKPAKPTLVKANAPASPAEAPPAN